MTVDNNLKWLMKWYSNQFHCDWKFATNINIQTLDNLGWDLQVYLEQTGLLDHQFQKLTIDRSENDWLRCYIENNAFYGVGGPFNLLEIFAIFRNWVESCEKNKKLENARSLEPPQLRNITRSFSQNKTEDNHFMWLIKWFHSQCNSDWEHMNTILIDAINPGWYVRIGIDDTEFDDIQFPEVYVNRSEDDWIQCFIRKQEFIGLGGPFNLMEILQVFRSWSENCPERDFSEEETNE